MPHPAPGAEPPHPLPPPCPMPSPPRPVSSPRIRCRAPCPVSSVRDPGFSLRLSRVAGVVLIEFGGGAGSSRRIHDVSRPQPRIACAGCRSPVVARRFFEFGTRRAAAAPRIRRSEPSCLLSLGAARVPNSRFMTFSAPNPKKPPLPAGRGAERRFLEVGTRGAGAVRRGPGPAPPCLLSSGARRFPPRRTRRLSSPTSKNPCRLRDARCCGIPAPARMSSASGTPGGMGGPSRCERMRREGPLCPSPSRCERRLGT